MKTFLALALCASLLSFACGSTRSRGAPDPVLREQLLAAVRGLEGRWEVETPGGEKLVHVFSVGASGTAVREIMFPGSPQEMTNMYTLAGNQLALTHYCAMGNQPTMRADGLRGNRIEFHSTGVSDLASPDEVYMAEMTLVLVDHDHIEQHWRAFKGKKLDHETVFKLARAR